MRRTRTPKNPYLSRSDRPATRSKASFASAATAATARTKTSTRTTAIAAIIGRSAAAVEGPGAVAGDAAEAGGDGCLEPRRVIGVEDEVVDDEFARRVEEVAAAGLALLARADHPARLDVEVEGESGY